MGETVRLSCESYRGDLAWVRKTLALNRAGPHLEVRIEAAVPHTDQRSAVDVFLRRKDIYLVGFRSAHGGVRFEDTDAIIPGIDFMRTLPVSPNYSVLGAWNESLSYRGVWAFHNAVANLEAVTRNSVVGKDEYRALILMIFAICEALRFWTIDKAIAEAICDSAVFRFIDWKDTVNNWDALSKGDQQGALSGVILPSV